jgi:hypothetical protein
MSLIAKPPAMVMLAAALWLTAVDLAWAQSPANNRDHFIALVANQQSPAIANRLQRELNQLDSQSRRLLK